VRSFTTKIGIPNNVPVDIGPARLGVMALRPGPPPSARIAVMPHEPGASGPAHEVSLGGEFPVGEERWRFTDVRFGPRPDRFVVTVERVDDDGTPAVLRPYGTCDEERLRAMETALGQPLPPRYRAWLAGTNGVQPDGRHRLPGKLFELFEERPLLGVHPQFPPFDLLFAEETQRRLWLPAGYLVVAVPWGGLLAVQLAGPQADAVVLLPDEAKTGPADADAAAARAQYLEPVGSDMVDFLGRLRRYAE
jgi:hypothetical protein